MHDKLSQNEVDNAFRDMVGDVEEHVSNHEALVDDNPMYKKLLDNGYSEQDIMNMLGFDEA